MFATSSAPKPRSRIPPSFQEAMGFQSIDDRQSAGERAQIGLVTQARRARRKVILFVQAQLLIAGDSECIDFELAGDDDDFHRISC